MCLYMIYSPLASLYSSPSSTSVIVDLLSSCYISLHAKLNCFQRLCLAREEKKEGVDAWGGLGLWLTGLFGLA